MKNNIYSSNKYKILIISALILNLNLNKKKKILIFYKKA